MTINDITIVYSAFDSFLKNTSTHPDIKTLVTDSITILLDDTMISTKQVELLKYYNIIEVDSDIKYSITFSVIDDITTKAIEGAEIFINDSIEPLGITYGNGLSTIQLPEGVYTYTIVHPLSGVPDEKGVFDVEYMDLFIEVRF